MSCSKKLVAVLREHERIQSVERLVPHLSGMERIVSCIRKRHPAEEVSPRFSAILTKTKVASVTELSRKMTALEEFSKLCRPDTKGPYTTDAVLFDCTSNDVFTDMLADLKEGDDIDGLCVILSAKCQAYEGLVSTFHCAQSEEMKQSFGACISVMSAARGVSSSTPSMLQKALDFARESECAIRFK